MCRKNSECNGSCSHFWVRVIIREGLVWLELSNSTIPRTIWMRVSQRRMWMFTLELRNLVFHPPAATHLLIYSSVLGHLIPMSPQFGKKNLMQKLRRNPISLISSFDPFCSNWSSVCNLHKLPRSNSFGSINGWSPEWARNAACYWKESLLYWFRVPSLLGLRSFDSVEAKTSHPGQGTDQNK